jgi:quinol monooxygenase YgiN
VLVLTRLRVPQGEAEAFGAAADDLLRLLAAAPGYLRGHVGRAADDPDLWVLATEWEGVGAYRRALSSYDVKMTAPAVMTFAVHEPSAFEVLVTEEPAEPV